MHMVFKFTSDDGPTLGRRTNSYDARSTDTWDQVKSELARAGYKDVRPIRREWPAWAWPGGYPLYYLVKDGGVLSYQAANAELRRTLDKDDDQFFIVVCEVNYEDPELYCDHTEKRIPSAYVEDDRAEHIRLMDQEYRLRDQPELHGLAESQLKSWLEHHPIFQEQP